MAQDKLIFGIHSLLEALSSGKELDKIFIRRGLRTEETKEIARLAREHIIPVQIVPEEKLNRLTNKNHQGVAAFLSQIEYTALEQLLPILYEQGRTPLLLILDGITDVRNFGAIARSAECAGVDAIIIPERGSVSVTGDAIKTSSGALLRIPVCRTPSISQLIRLLQSYGIRLFVSSEKGEKLFTAADLTLPSAIIMGAEDVGPSPESLRLADEIIRIPQVGNIGSLNVSVAASLMVYEALRQRML